MWQKKSEEVKRLREIAFSCLKLNNIDIEEINKNDLKVKIIIYLDTQKKRSDLDNFISGILDGLQKAPDTIKDKVDKSLRPDEFIILG